MLLDLPCRASKIVQYPRNCGKLDIQYPRNCGKLDILLFMQTKKSSYSKKILHKKSVVAQELLI
jgi:hypothetical protein